MSEVTKEDLNRVYDQISENKDDINDIAIILAKLNTTLEKLEIPIQPCKYLTEHLANHKDTANAIKHKIIGATVNIAQMAIVGLVVYYISTK